MGSGLFLTKPLDLNNKTNNHNNMNWEKLLKAVESPRWSSETTYMMDNDGGYWTCNNQSLTEQEIDYLEGELNNEFGVTGLPKDDLCLLYTSDAADE